MAGNLISDQELKDLMDKDLLELIGAQNLSEEKKAELYQKMAETVQNRTIARVYDTLTEEEGKELDALIDAGDYQKVDEYLKSKNMDITAMMVQEALIYKTEMTDLFKNIKEGENA